MSRFKSNVVGNIAAAGWTAVLQLVCVPIFIKLMGVEGYGLIGFYLTLQMSLQVLDFGLSLTVNRELARYSTHTGDTAVARDFVRTLEVLYWMIGTAIGISITLLAPVIADHWIKPSTLQPSKVRDAVQLMALVFVFQWPLIFYTNCLNGLQQQVLANFVRVGMTAFGLGGAVLVLWRVSPSVTAFFTWQVITSALQAWVILTVTWRCMPRGTRSARWDFSLIRGVRSFTGGLAGITTLGVILTQMDKVVLSRLLSLDEFGYYIVAGIAASCLQLFITPIFTAVFPRFSGLLMQKDSSGIQRLYHESTQLMAVLVIPTAVVLALYAPQVLALWTGDSVVANQAAPVARLLIAGTAINGLMNLPYALQLAHSWTSLGLKFSLVKVMIFLPLLIWMAESYGALGGAATWAAMNATYMLAGVPLMHRRLLQGDATRWFFKDVGQPLCWTLAVVALYRELLGQDAGGWKAGFEVIGAGLTAMLTAVLAAPEIRARVLRHLPSSASQ